MSTNTLIIKQLESILIILNMHENAIKIPNSSITILTLSMLKQSTQSQKVRSAILTAKIILVVVPDRSVVLIPVRHQVLDNAEIGA